MKDSKIEELEAQRISLIHKLSSLPSDILNYQIKDGKWSILQILEHIILSEELSLGYALKKTQKPSKLRNVSVKNWISGKILNRVLRLNIKYKAPAVVYPSADGALNLHDLERRWEESRKKIFVLNDASPKVLEKGILKHPYTGYMNFSQMLTFFSAHYVHHLSQISEIVDSKNK